MAGKKKSASKSKKKPLDKCAKWAKSRYKVWPSAYASGAAVKCRKGKAGPNKRKKK
jgi:hypothetical protein